MRRLRVNENVTAFKVRLIGADGKQIGIVSSEEALKKAHEENLDLVEIVPELKPPVCRIMDYGKYLFEQGKRKKKKSKQIQIKEIKMRPGTDIADYKIKLRKAIGFLQQGNKVKITVRFRGREMAYKELGEDILKRAGHDLEEFGSIEQPPKSEGRQIAIVVGPKK
jgi:translation initiation factor IF-3